MARPFLRTQALRALSVAAGIGLSSTAAAQSFLVLDKQRQLDRFTWWDNRDWDWFKARIPFFESPDEEIDATYYYRWELVTKHLTYGSPASGYSFKEFIEQVGWAGSYGAISCPMGLQMYELRWLKDRRITDDYVRYWFDTPGAQPRSYSTWYADAVWANYLVNGDRSLVVNRLPSMEAQYAGWLREHWDPKEQMFHWSGMHDGMEINIASLQTSDAFAGADSYRPTLNSYVYGDLLATANTADLASEHEKAGQYRAKAQALKEKVQTRLWDPQRQFFIGRFHDNETSPDGKYAVKAGTRIYQDGQFAGNPHGRELSGYVPWMFNLPDKDKSFEAAWKGVVDPDVFFAKYGLSFTERHDPLFLIGNVGGVGGACVWRGNNWPYADSQTLMAVANVINNYPQRVIGKGDYFKVFQAYTHAQRKDGKPYIAEDQDPDTGRWINDQPNHSDHYFHSSYVDLLVTGLVGLRPRADDVIELDPLAPEQWNYFALDDVSYHGHRISIFWDRDGTRYHRGAGLTILADGSPIATNAKLAPLQGRLPAVTPPAAPVDRPVNFAVNNDQVYYPRVSASFTAQDTSASNLNDGTFYYSAPRPVNRWTTVGSPNAGDSVEVDFGVARPVETVKLYLLDDSDGNPVRAPESYALEFWDGSAWKQVPGQRRTPAVPVGHRPNVIDFPVLSTGRLRAVLSPRAGSAVGLTEFEAWGHAALPLAQGQLPPTDFALGAKASASFTSRFDRVEEINDGHLAKSGQGRNRWTAFESPNASDWVQLDFARPVQIGRVEVYWWADGGGVRLPKNYRVQCWSGDHWVEAQETGRSPSVTVPDRPSELTITPTQTEKLRVIFDHALPGKTGISELLVWEK